jgi:hypothetical protein
VIAGSLLLDDGGWELGGVGSALRFRGVVPAVNGVLLARRRVARVGWGAWAGAGGGFVSRADIQAPILAADVGGWWQAGGRTLSLALVVQRARLDSGVAGPPGVPGPIVGPVGVGAVGSGVPRAGTPNAPATLVGVLAAAAVRPLATAELSGSAAWRHRRGELAATLGVRRAPAQFDGVRGLALASGVWWARPRAGLVVSGGEQFADPLRGMPAVRHLSLGVRWRIAPAPATTPLVRPPPEPEVRPGSVVAELARSDAAGVRRLRVRAPGATRVEVRGDWTDWQPVLLVPREEDTWELSALIPVGTRRLSVRVDGGAWQLPGNLAAADDDFGSRVALLVVP